MSYPINKFTSPPSSRHLTRSKDTIPSSDQFKQKILSQNRALAKKNSILMTKVADLEVKISDLIQQNIELRAINAKSEDQKRRWLEDKLNIIESGVSQRFEEMFQMFATIRSNESLSSSSINVSRVIENVSNENSSDKAVSFHDVKSPSKSNISERRRKSARRQSIYIAPPDSPHQNQYEANEFEKLEIPAEFDTPSVFQDERTGEYSGNLFDEPQINDTYIPEERESELEKVESYEHHEIEDATRLSPIKFSSPKRPDSHPKFSVYTESDEVETPTEEEMNLKIQKLAADSVKSSSKRTQKVQEQRQESEGEEHVVQDLGHIIDFAEINDKAEEPLLHDIEKIKHTNSKKRKQRSFKDENMPESISSDVLSTRKSRSRGKSVNYAEPSLRKKMRRESEQLTDAVVDRNLEIKVESTSQPQTLKKDTVDQELLKASRESPIKALQTSSPVKSAEVPKEASKVEEPKPKQASLIEQDNRNITNRRKPLGTLNQNKIPKRDSKSFKKMQLDIDAAELSVFDLVDECEVGVPKTLKNAPEISLKKSSRKSSGSRRNSMLL